MLESLKERAYSEDIGADGTIIKLIGSAGSREGGVWISFMRHRVGAVL